MEQKIVVHTKAGVIHKGVTQDFEAERDDFHFLPAEGGGVPIRFRLEDLKAVFWVKDYLGNRQFVASRQFGARHQGPKAVVEFSDGEEMWGTLDSDRPIDQGVGFYLTPVDEEDNNERVFVVRSALKDVRLEP